MPACTPPLAEDVESLCKVVNEVTRDNTLGTPARKLERIASRSPEYTKGALENKNDNLAQKLAAAPIEGRYQALVDVAKSVGKNDYKCKPYEQLLYSIVIEEQAKKKEAEQQKAEAAAATPPPEPAPVKQETKQIKQTKKKKKKHKR
jgi:hypothetical protein